MFDTYNVMIVYIIFIASNRSIFREFTDQVPTRDLILQSKQ